MGGKKSTGRIFDAVALGGGYGPGGYVLVGAVFDLHQGQGAATAGDDIDLAEPGPIAAGDDPVTL